MLLLDATFRVLMDIMIMIFITARCYLLLDATLGVLMDSLIKNEIHCC